jgi:hypothetical protein
MLGVLGMPPAIKTVRKPILVLIASVAPVDAFARNYIEQKITESFKEGVTYG